MEFLGCDKRKANLAHGARAKRFVSVSKAWDSISFEAGVQRWRLFDACGIFAEQEGRRSSPPNQFMRLCLSLYQFDVQEHYRIG